MSVTEQFLNYVRERKGKAGREAQRRRVREKRREKWEEKDGDRKKERETGERGGETVHHRGHGLLPVGCGRHWPISVTGTFKDIR